MLWLERGDECLPASTAQPVANAESSSALEPFRARGTFSPGRNPMTLRAIAFRFLRACIAQRVDQLAWPTPEQHRSPIERSQEPQQVVAAMRTCAASRAR